MPGSVAARVSGWQRRLGALAGPLGPAPVGSGEQFAGTAVEVELLVDGEWQPITSRVMVRDNSGVIGITRGQPNEGSKTLPAVCTMQLNNRDGLFSPRKADSPYFGKIGRNTQLRVSVPLGNGKNYRFWGEVPSWPSNWDVTGTDVWVQLEAAGVLRRLGQGNQPIGSAMYLSLASLTQAGTVVAYWPCEDASGATSIASATGGRPMTIQGTPSLASSTVFVCSTALPTMGSGSFSGAVPTYVTKTTGDFDAAVRFLLQLPAAGSTNGQVVCRVSSSGTVTTWEVYYTSGFGGFLGIRGFNSSGTLVTDSGAAAGVVDGVLLQITTDFSQVGSSVNFDLFLQVVGTSGVGGGFSGSVASSTLGSFTAVTINPGLGLTGAVVGHVSVQTGGTLVSRTQELNAFVGETAADRVSRLCGIAGVGFELVGVASSSALMGAQLSDTLVNLIDESVTADGGLLFESTDQLGLGYRTRVSLENQAASLALSYSGFNLSEVPVPVDDDRFTRNDVTVSRQGGSSARSTLATGNLSILPPPSGVGPYQTSVAMNVVSDAALPDEAGWLVHLGTVDEARYPRLAVNLAQPSFAANPALRPAALLVDPGDRVTVSGMPSFGQLDNVSQLAVGSAETISNFQHRIGWNCTPESPYRVAITDNNTFGHADTAGTVLTVGAGPADTSLSVTTTVGAAWTQNPADYPFDLRVGGEQVTAFAAGQALGTADGSFESGMVGWSSGGGTFVQSTDFAYRGTHSGLLTTTGSPSQSTVRPDGTHDAPVVVGQQYRGSMWVYSVAGYGSVIAAVDWFDSGHGYLSTSVGTSAAVPAGVWTLFTVTGTAPASSAFGEFGPTVTGSPPNGTAVYVDDVFFVATSSFTGAVQQSLSVVRSVNGVVKAQTAGSDVRLFQPAIAAL